MPFAQTPSPGPTWSVQWPLQSLPSVDSGVIGRETVPSGSPGLTSPRICELWATGVREDFWAGYQDKHDV